MPEHLPRRATPLRRVAVSLAIGGVTAATIAFGAAPAAAHAELTPSTTAAGEYAVLEFAIGHGCDGSATTKVAVDIPKGIDVTTPTVNPGWKIATDSAPLPKSQSSEEHNERTTTVTYTARQPLPDGQRDTFELSVPLPDDPGRTLVFPTVQTCEQGSNDWTQVPEQGQDADELEYPAPSMTLTEGTADETSGDAAPGESADSDAAADSGSDSGNDALSWTALGVGVVGIGVGATALARTRRRA